MLAHLIWGALSPFVTLFVGGWAVSVGLGSVVALLGLVALVPDTELEMPQGDALLRAPPSPGPADARHDAPCSPTAIISFQ